MPFITLGGTELRRTDSRIHSWIRRGLLHPATYRGTNNVIVGRAGEEAMPKIKSHRPIELGQRVKGAGATEAIAQADFLDLSETLRELYESTVGAPQELRVYGPLYGIPGDYWSLNVEWLNNIEEDPMSFWQKLTARFNCIDNPPDWVKVPL